MADFVHNTDFQELIGENRGNANHEGPITLEKFTELMKQFYGLGWMRGSGGAMGCLTNNELIISPSALQKERIRKEDLFVYNFVKKTEVQRPENKTITVSSCAVLFSLIMNRTGSECVIHTHSKSSNLLTQLIDKKNEVFEISHQEYIKGVYDPFSGKNLKYNDTLVIPIINNRPSESLLLGPIEEVLNSYPQSVAVLVRNHGLFVWGPTWEQTKIITECIEYLLELSIDMIKNDIPLIKEDDPSEEREDSVDYLETVFSP